MPRPNILFLMVDQMQGEVLDSGHVCHTPNLDRLVQRGVRFSRAYTPNAICSPARASLMTGLLPHNHGVLTVIHTVDDDQCCLRTAKPHWAQRLGTAGYRTGYFGKWHVERTRRLDLFGWQTFACEGGNRLRQAEEEARAACESATFSLEMALDQPPGYQSQRLYGVTDSPPEQRGMGLRTRLAMDFLEGALPGGEPWCCFVSMQEPHDPFICGGEAFERYDVDTLPLSPSCDDDLEGRPGIYRKAARVFAHMSDRQRREAAACYYASITEIDQQFGRLIDRVEAAGQLDRTLVVFTSDHGELLGAHGLYCKNFTAAEEVYRIPLVAAGPGVARGGQSLARVGLHDLAPTLLELTGCRSLNAGDSRSFASLLREPDSSAAAPWIGYAEYFGGRMLVTQRVVWDDPWKFVFNGFDQDELYNLDEDPFEMSNRIDDPTCDQHLRRLVAHMWRRCRDTGDDSLYNSQYPILRVAPYGPSNTASCRPPPAPALPSRSGCTRIERDGPWNR